MELIQISDKKLKIMLSPPDMVKYALEGDTLERVTSHTREAFRNIFREVYAQSGFDTDDTPLFIQLYKSRGGGCEIFVTKLEEGVHRDPSAEKIRGSMGDPCLTGDKDALSDGERRLLEKINREERTFVTQSFRSEEEFFRLFVFEDTASLLGACRRLHTSGYRGRSSVYIMEDPHKNEWVLLLNGNDLCEIMVGVLQEYGIECNATLPYVIEHGRTILQNNAVDVLEKL